MKPNAPDGRNSRPSRGALFLAGTLASLIVATVFSISAGIPDRGKKNLTKPPVLVSSGSPAGVWSQVDRLVSEQKFEEAARSVELILERAKKGRDEEEWTRALIRDVQLRSGLHGYETAVRFLREQPWPDSPLSRSVLNLFYVQTLDNYLNVYAWEIGQREKIDTKGVVDLKSWTREQIFLEAQRACAEVWGMRKELGAEPLAKWSEYLTPNNFPPRIRGTLRDAISYQITALLANSSHWKPEQSNELFRLDFPSLVQGGATPVPKMDDEKTHPLVKLASVYDDLEAWHTGEREREAAFEARLDRLRHLHSAFTDEKNRAVIRADLEKRLTKISDLEWWSAGKAALAEFLRENPSPDSLIRAHAIAGEGSKSFPSSIGGQRCLSIAKSIEAPSYQVISMSSDGAGRRSIEVTHKNLRKLWFRAYAADLMKTINGAKDYNLLPAWREIPELMKNGRPIAEWSVDLPATPDYREHRTFVTPPLEKPSLYVVAASARPDFAEDGNRIEATDLIVTDLVLLVRQAPDGDGVEAQCVSGESGKALSGVEVMLYKYDWQQGHHRIESKTTGDDGVVHFAHEKGRESYQHFLVARRGIDQTVDPQYLGLSGKQKRTERTASLVYTDRSVYRPLQKVLWKVLAYRGGAENWKYSISPETPVTVSMLDANRQVVETKTVSTNGYGTASGEFLIPSGRLLGGWSIQANPSGVSSIRVEEYKRPTFEVKILDPASPLRLGRPARLTGEARYYFGLPVVNGQVAWRVSREPVYPWWWWGCWDWSARGGRGAGVQVVANGTSPLGADGKFALAFTPEAGEKDVSSKGVTFRYSLSVDVTDEGGESRSANRSFRLGFVSVEASLGSETQFFREGAPAELSLRRSDLDGIARAGKGGWRLMALAAPARALLPADQPIERAPTGKGDREVRTAGDDLRPRWDSRYSPDSVLRQWADGRKISEGTVVHDDKGEAKIVLPNLSAGAYRLRYETLDDAGAKFETEKTFLVAGRGFSGVPLPFVALAESSSVPVGGTARLLVQSALNDQPLYYEVYRGQERIERKVLRAGRDTGLIEIPVLERDRGGFAVSVTAVRDHQLMTSIQTIFVPWSNKELKVEFATFRDLIRPGARESWRVTVKGAGEKSALAGSAELLAYMYDRSLDTIAPHSPPSPMGIFPNLASAVGVRANLGQVSPQWTSDRNFAPVPNYPYLIGDQLKFLSGYGIGGPGARGFANRQLALAESKVAMNVPASAPAVAEPARKNESSDLRARSDGNEIDEIGSLGKAKDKKDSDAGSSAEASPLRQNFAETAFWEPHLLTDRNGSASIEFTVPDSVTSWNVWVHAVTKGLSSGSMRKETKSVKDLMVRPYLPRFLREGDRAELKVVVNNSSKEKLSGELSFEIFDPETNKSLLSDFGLSEKQARLPFSVAAGSGSNLTIPLTAPNRVGQIAVKVTARSGDTSDGELRALPLLPSRVHLVQSRFAALKNADRRVLRFDDLAKGGDPTRIDEQMVVTVDAQLFYGVLEALPYLIDYPYECTEQTLNRFLSTGILSSLYSSYPAVSKMAAELSKRETRLETWDAADPNRKMALEESPWLQEAKGGAPASQENPLIKVLDPKISRAQRDGSLAKLARAQTSLGAFPWWPGGPPSPWMTLYILHGLSKGLEFKVEVPKDMTVKGWSYLHRHYIDDIEREMRAQDCCWEFITFLNYVLSNYPDTSFCGGVFTDSERKEMLDFSFKHWRDHSPLLKGYLALTLKRSGRAKDAKLVFDSVMDSAKTDADLGTYWAPEDRAWLWYNDTIETHAFALRALMELDPKDRRSDGLVLWLFLNKKMNHWKSTRATAEVVYSLAHYFASTGALGVRESATVTAGSQSTTFVFEPDKYTGKKNQIIIPGGKIDPATTSSIVVEKTTPGLMFASATWHFSTEKLPEEDRGDFFQVSRKYFRRENRSGEWTLVPLADGARLAPGDEVEVQLSLRARAASEYVQLRDPRAAGLEPDSAASKFKWDLGIGWYEEIRGSGTNFFFEQLPAGEYTFKYRLRANMAGSFRVGPATVQSVYAPEFAAYSAGNKVNVSGK